MDTFDPENKTYLAKGLSTLYRTLRKTQKRVFYILCDLIEEDKPYHMYSACIEEEFKAHGFAIEATIQAAVDNENVLHKHDKKAKQIQSKGRLFYDQQKYEESLKCFTVALTFTENKQIKAMIYRNMAESLASLKKMQFSVDAIKIADTLDPAPSETTQPRDLAERFFWGAYRTTTSWEPYEIPEQSANPRNSDLSIALTKKDDGVFANRKLLPGNIVAITDPYLKGPREYNDFTHCYNCWRDVTGISETQTTFNEIQTCDRCVYTVWCSEECKEEGLFIHQMFCREAFRVYNTFCNYGIMAMHFACKTLFQQVDIRDKKFEYDESMNIFDSKANNRDWKNFESFCGLKTNRIRIVNADLIILTAFNLIHVLMQQPTSPFPGLINKSEHGFDRFLKGFWKAYKAAHFNTMTLQKHQEDLWGLSHLDVLYTNFKHCCDPNVNVVRLGNPPQNYYQITKEVQKGEELFVAYG